MKSIRLLLTSKSVVLCIIAVLVTIIVACGDDGAEAPEATAAPATAAPTQAVAP